MRLRLRLRRGLDSGHRARARKPPLIARWDDRTLARAQPSRAESKATILVCARGIVIEVDMLKQALQYSYSLYSYGLLYIL